MVLVYSAEYTKVHLKALEKQFKIDKRALKMPYKYFSSKCLLGETKYKSKTLEYLYEKGVSNNMVGIKMETIFVKDHSRLMPITPNTIMMSVLKA